MNMRWRKCLTAMLLACGSAASANEPVSSYIFPAGGQRGTKCAARVGGLFLHDGCRFDWATSGLKTTTALARVPTIWFEGPLIPLPESQQAEDYPQDYATQIDIAADAPLGSGYWRLATSEGATAARRFVVGDLPEVVEEEIDGEPIPVAVKLPVTINGRIFPREDVDIWTFDAHKGQTIRAEVCASRLGSPFEGRIEIIDAAGRRLAEGVGGASGEADVCFTPEADATYSIRIHDINFGGLQNYVYRLTLGGGPHVESVFPLGGRRGEKTRFQLIGDEPPAEPVEVALGTSDAPTYLHRFEVGGQLSNTVPIEVDNLPEQIEREANNDAEHAEAASLPGIVNGRIQAPGDVDWFTFVATKGQAYDFDLRASRLGSPLDAVLTVFDAEGKELARSDDIGEGNTDSACQITAPADGMLRARVEDRLASRGGPTFAYRLRVDVAQPDFQLTLGSDAISLVRGKDTKLRIDVDSAVPIEVPIDLEVEGLPEGVTVAGSQIPPKGKQAELKFTVPEQTAIRTGRLTVRGRASSGDRKIARVAVAKVRRGEPPLDHVFWAVAMPAPFKFVGTFKFGYEPRGGFVERHYRLVRGGYTGPLEVSLADRQMRHLQGVSGQSITVPAGAEAFDYTAYLPPWMELGRTSRTCLAAVGNVKDFDDTEHLVSFSTTEQNEQFVVRVSSGLLTVAIDRSSILAVPGGTSTVRVSVAREPSRATPVKIELIVPAHIRGVRAEPLVLGTAENSGPFTIEYAAECGTFNMPLTLRATSLDAARAAVAEARLEVVAPR
jgi:hypothetical protein